MIPKRHWSLYSKPTFFLAPPKPPQEELEIKKEEVLVTKTKECYDEEVTFKLEDLIPSNHDIEGLQVRVCSYIDYSENYSSISIKVLKVTTSTVVNPKYEKQMVKYKKDLKDWEDKKSSHEEDLRQWELWVKQGKAKELEDKLKAAEKLLKKHGRLTK